jgi:hypothetical protein
MKKLVAAALAVAMLFSLAAKAQAPATTSWTIHPSSGCVPSVKYPAYYCFAYASEDGATGTVGSTLSLYIQVNPDGSFSNGHLSMSDLYGNPPAFTSVNWTGSNFSGSFSGTQPDGTVYSGSATVTMGTIRRCSRWTCQYIFGPVGGNVTVTFQ